MQKLFGESLVSNSCDTVPVSQLESVPVVAIYFSAHWCPPCRGFTPVLAGVYEEINDSSKQLEIVFVTSDRDQDSFQGYFSTMPWLALPHGHPNITQLKQAMGISGIPTLVILNKDGSVKTKDGRAAVMNKGPECIQEWL